MKMLFLASLLVCGTVSASIVPQNSLRIPVGMKSNGGLTEEQFVSAISKVETIYSPLVKEITGKILHFKNSWTNETVNAGAYQERGLAVVEMYGGLARFPSVTKDSLSLVICHELGHHIGGAPKNFGAYNWATVESQADYFATLKCLRRVFLNDDNAAAVKGARVPEDLKISCEKNHKDDDINICIRSGLAALEIQRVFMFLRKEKSEGSFSTPDPKIVEFTDSGHGGTQCRLDTFLQGAICEVPYSEDVSQKDDIQGTCHASSGHSSGLRPLCWYKPLE